MESLVEKALDGLLAADAAFDYAAVKALCAPAPSAFLSSPSDCLTSHLRRAPGQCAA